MIRELVGEGWRSINQEFSPDTIWIPACNLRLAMLGIRHDESFSRHESLAGGILARRPRQVARLCRRPTSTGELPQYLPPPPLTRRLVIDVGGKDDPRAYLPDVAIKRALGQSCRSGVWPWRRGCGRWPNRSLVDRGEHKLRRLEIADSTGHIITVIEFLSPSRSLNSIPLPLGTQTPRNLARGSEPGDRSGANRFVDAARA